MAQDWSGFERVDDPRDEWEGFEEVKPSTPSQASPRAQRTEPAPSPNQGRVTGAVDGDTLRMGDGPNLRLWGIDAPELRQPGRLRDGTTIEAGQQSRDALLSILGNGDPVAGEAVMQSYSRPVAPVTVGGNDVGMQMLRGGQAYAAPEYLQDHQDRRFQYLQAQRLAAQNRLGVHDMAIQKPEDFRDDPQPVVPRHMTGMSWHTPTPFSGLPPAVEQQIVQMTYDPEVPVEDVVALARDHGMGLDPVNLQHARNHYLVYGEAGSLEYLPDEVVTTELGDGATGAGIRGFGSGVVLDGFDELGAVVDAIGGTDDRENIWNSDRRFADIWANNQRQNEAILRGDDRAHPVASTAGEVTGAITSGFLLPYSAGARTVPQLARVGAAYGGISGFMGGEGGIENRVRGAAIGAPLGAIADPLLGKAVDVAAPIVGRAIRGTVEAGQSGVEAGRRALSRNAAEAPLEGSTSASVADEWAGFEEVAPAPRTAAMDGEQMPALSGDLPRPERMDQPTSEALRRAAAENLTPGEVLPIPGNQVRNVEEAASVDAGRYSEALAINERDELTRRTVTNYMGRAVPKVGPIDMVGWLRLNGGLVDQGGELATMGITSNAARRGMDHVGQEMRFGPILNERGMTLDDAAMRAWEAGYFPELTDRPTINEFLDALRETYDGGTGRRFMPDDAPELLAFEQRQVERFDLEQRQHEAGGAVYNDRSVPANEPAPFPPVEAYEEWPDGGPDLAGNIDLRRLESPQDIRRALSQTERRIGFDGATRGRVTQAETERLAGELNMTADQLLSRRRGQAFNAEEALAARQLLARSGNDLVNAARRVRALENPGDEELAEFRNRWMRHVAIQEQVSGMTAEAGRTLQQFKQVASSRNVRGSALGAFVRAGGGADNLRDTAEAILEAAEVSPGVFNALVEKAAKPRFRDKIAELYINMLLSGPQTHAVNMASNTLTAMAQIPEFAGASVLGRARQAFTSRELDRVLATEVGARAFGMMQGTREGLRLFGRSLRTGEASDFVTKVEGDEYRAISGLKGEVIRVPTRLLTAEDELFKGIARRMELNGQAVRQARKEGLRGAEARARIAELSANPTDEMTEAALDYGRYLTFQRQLGPVASKVSGVTNESLIAKIFLPFVRTPTNLVKFAAERSPAAPLLKEWRQDFMAGGARRDLAIARAAIGTGMGMLVYEAALDGRITGAAPSDPKKARLLYADGWKPYSIRIGDKYYSYRRFDPFSTTLGVAADMATLPENMSERQRNDKTTLLVASIMGNLASKTWMSGMSDLMGALDDPERNAGNLLERLAGAFTVPTGVNQVARIVDPTLRETGSVGEAIQNRIPGLSEKLLPRRNIWGEALETEGGVGPDIISPVWQSTARNDPVNMALLELDYAPGYPSRTVGGQELTPEQYDAYLASSGKAAHDGLSRLVQSPAWQAMDNEERTTAAQRIVRQARSSARDALFGGGSSADSWDDFEEVGDGTGWEEFEAVP